MMLEQALLAAFGCALCNGLAAVLQKIGVDKTAAASSLRVGLFFWLLRSWPYLAGTVLDGVAWILTLIAVHSLPLFVVQPIIACSVVITVLVESLVLHKRLRLQTIIAISCIVVGLLVLATTAAPEGSASVSGLVRPVIILMPLPIGVAGAIFAKLETHLATITLAALSGLAFGGTAIVGRMLRFSTPYWHVFLSPLFVALLAYGLSGILLFTIALQRHHASVVNALMITFETIAPIAVGLLFLGDSPRHGLWLVMIVGAGVALTGTVLVAAKGTREP
jgi:drug/metabolite transporter (DMT)-like permease